MRNLKTSAECPRCKRQVTAYEIKDWRNENVTVLLMHTGDAEPKQELITSLDAHLLEINAAPLTPVEKQALARERGNRV